MNKMIVLQLSTVEVSDYNLYGPWAFTLITTHKGGGLGLTTTPWMSMCAPCMSQPLLAPP